MTFIGGQSTPVPGLLRNGGYISSTAANAATAGLLLTQEQIQQYMEAQTLNWLKSLFSKIGQVMDDVEGEIDQIKAIDPDSSYTDRVIRDIKQHGYDKLQETIVDGIL